MLLVVAACSHSGLLSRIPTGMVCPPISLEQTNFDLQGMVQDTLSFVRSMHPEQKGRVTLGVDIPSSVPTEGVCGYKGALERILKHLLSNGLKLTQVGSVTLYVSYSKDSEMPADLPSGHDAGVFTFTVKSTSPQIPEDKIHQLWAAYWQGGEKDDDQKDQLTNSIDGLGLGLHVAFNLVQ